MSGEEEVRLSKTALRIYLYLLNKGRPAGPREIARELGISPSLAYYHLKRLEEQGLVSKSRDGYSVSSRLAIEGFIALGRRLVPRMYIYAALFAGFLAAEILSLATGITKLSGSSILLLAVTLIALAITVFEGRSLKKRLGL